MKTKISNFFVLVVIFFVGLVYGFLICTNPYVAQQLASQKVLGGSGLRWGRCLVRERL